MRQVAQLSFIKVRSISKRIYIPPTLIITHLFCLRKRLKYWSTFSSCYRYVWSKQLKPLERNMSRCAENLHSVYPNLLFLQGSSFMMRKCIHLGVGSSVDNKSGKLCSNGMCMFSCRAFIVLHTTH